MTGMRSKRILASKVTTGDRLVLLGINAVLLSQVTHLGDECKFEWWQLNEDASGVIIGGRLQEMICHKNEFVEILVTEKDFEQNGH